MKLIVQFKSILIAAAIVVAATFLASCEAEPHIADRPLHDTIEQLRAQNDSAMLSEPHHVGGN